MTEGEGRLLGGRYRLERVLGRGGMGTVWLARDEVLNRRVAIKEVRTPRALEDDQRDVLHQRMMREARAAARLSHPGIVTVHDVVEFEGSPWIVMEYVEADTLQDVIDAQGSLPPARVAEIGRQILGALRAAHLAGILHRDVKPANVMLSEDRAVLTDFGIAQVEGDTSLTQTGIVMGSPAYISPERAQGMRPGPPSDLWALGCLLYAACEGKPPHDRPDVLSTLAAVMMEPVPPPTNTGPLTKVILGLLDKDPLDRLDAAAAAELLHQVGESAYYDPERTLSDTPRPALLATRAIHTTERSGNTFDNLYRVDGPSPGLFGVRTQPAGAVVPEPRGTADEGWMQRLDAGHAPAVQEAPKKRGFFVSMIIGGLVGVIAIVVSLVVLRPMFGTEKVDDGFKIVEGDGFSLMVPEDWTYEKDNVLVQWQDPDSPAYIQVDTRDWGPGTPADSLALGRCCTKLQALKQLGLSEKSIDGRPTADLEITFWYSQSNQTRHAINRRFRVGSTTFALFIVFNDSDWNREVVDNILDSFRP